MQANKLRVPATCGTAAGQRGTHGRCGRGIYLFELSGGGVRFPIGGGRGPILGVPAGDAFEFVGGRVPEGVGRVSISSIGVGNTVRIGEGVGLGRVELEPGDGRVDAFALKLVPELRLELRSELAFKFDGVAALKLKFESKARFVLRLVF